MAFSQPGQVVGKLGKTTEPHLYLSAQHLGSIAEPLSGELMAITIDGCHVVRNDRVRVNPALDLFTAGRVTTIAFW